MEREQYFEAVQDAIEALEAMLKIRPEVSHHYRPTISALEWELDRESEGVELALWLNGSKNGQA